MNKREMIQYLKQNMPDFQGNDEEIEVKTALYIYVELGKIKSFNEKYYFGNSQTQKKIYRLAERQSREVDEIAEKKKIICVSLTYLYCSILKEFGIQAVASIPEQDGHIYPVITTKGKKFVADLQLDLENIQTQSRLKHFEYRNGSSQDNKPNANQDEITKMLIEVGYIKDERDYKNQEIEKLIEQVKNKNPHEALKIILENENLYHGNVEMESVEVDKFYKGLLKKVVPHFWETRIFAFNCYRQKEDEQRDYTLCVFSEEDTIKPYLFSKKDRRFLRVEISKMKELEEKGLRLGAKPKENGANKLKKYINRQEEKENIEPK